ncbi:unnamed protein product [Linum trigynum]|uniref:BEACH domain-containing protein B n=1 Tax=Linum trigynum TaxID=586398 RepID=A0AAV2DGE2_9ROSI
MNIVKGVADLIRRTSNIQTGESSSRSTTEKFPAPAPKICFSEEGDEAILHTLWKKHESITDKVDKRKLFHVFLKQFVTAFKNWVPVNAGQFIETTPTTNATEYPFRCADVVVGCFAGHPAEIILALIEEIGHITTLIADLNSNGTHAGLDLSQSPSLNVSAEGLPVLDALTIITRSMHNCRVFGCYSGVQKLTALLKGAVVQLKGIAGALSGEENLSDPISEKTLLLQQILVHVISIMCNFIDLNTNAYGKAVFAPSIYASTSSKVLTDSKMYWRQKAVVAVMEAGGLNWLVELLRVIRRLSLKEQWTDISLQNLTLKILHIALVENPRGQNHFKSIGGLEVLLDGLGLPSINVLLLKNATYSGDRRDENPWVKIFELHALSLTVLREAVFRNLSSLQYLCENGRIQKFANSFCALAFMLQEYRQKTKESSVRADSHLPFLGLKCESHVILQPSFSLHADASHSQLWGEHVVKLSRVLCSFVVAPEIIKSQANTGPEVVPVSSAYGELSIRWVMRVLLTIFPCMKACSNQNEQPSLSRVFLNALQHCVLDAFRKVLVSSPISLEVFREERIWDLIFSENFFYFGAGGIEILQMEIVSYVEFAATCKGSVHNLPELSALLDALEQCACHSLIAKVLAKSLLRIFRLSSEKTIASFKTLNAISRVLRVACIQVEESRRSQAMNTSPECELLPTNSDPRFDANAVVHSQAECMETCMGLFKEFFLSADDAKSLVLHDWSCIECLFELFWQESMRNQVLEHVLILMKVTPSTAEDQKAKLVLCSKYLETFTQIKERERNYAELSVDLLVGMREMLTADPTYYQALFRDGECFLHVVSLLNGNLDEADGEKLVLNVLQTLTCLLASNDSSKAAFRALVGKGYQTLQSLLLDFCQWRPSEALLNALLDMLVDGKFDPKASPLIKNEDVIILYLSVLQKSSDSLRHYGLNMFQQLLRDSISNRASCVRSGMLSFLLDWFSWEDMDSVILKIAQLIQVIGGHSVSGKDIRKIFALLRSEKVGTRQQYCSLLLTTMLSMLNEKGPTAFFDLNGNDSGIIIKTPLQWPLNKGFSFSCWLRVENFPRNGTMGLFSFLSDNGKGCLAVLGKDKLIYESIHLKRHFVQLDIKIVRKKWHFLCITHSIGRAFSGGSLVKCYVDGALVSSERCRYAKVNDLLTSCRVGMEINLPQNEEDSYPEFIQDVSALHGQIGPVYLFSDAISSEQVQGIYSLGPSYMYAFLDNEATPYNYNPYPSGVLDVKDGLSSKVIFGLNAQASDGKKLFNASSVFDQSTEKKSFDAMVMGGTELCSRGLLQQIIYCVGGVSVFFPLIAQSDRYDNEENGSFEPALLTPITKERLTAEVLELIASVLDENLANQHQMHLLSGFSILGFLLQSVPPEQLNLDTLAALKHLFHIAANCGSAEPLVEDAISSIFLNPLIWVYANYNVQRELYMFLGQHFKKDPRLLKTLCRLPRVIDIIRQFYWDAPRSRFAIGSKPLLHHITKKIIGERPNREEIHKIRLLLLSLGEMSLGQGITGSDVKALVAFFEISQDMACIEDVLTMVIRALSQKSMLAAFLEQVDLIGGCHVFVNLLQLEHEPVRLLGLQFLGKLLIGLPTEKKGPRYFLLNVGRSKSISERHKKISSRMQPIFSSISDRLFRFPLTDNLCAILFDVLLGGASPRQVLQKQGLVDKQKSKGTSSHFSLPQILVLIFRYLSGCKDRSARTKIIRDLLDLLDSNSSNIEALVEHGWNAWLCFSVELDALKTYKGKSHNPVDEAPEQDLLRHLFCVVLCHYVRSVKGGWQILEDTVNFLLMHSQQGDVSYHWLLRDIYEDAIERLLDSCFEENVFAVQPCRDNTLYLLRLLDEMLCSEMDHSILLSANDPEMSLDLLESESHKGTTFGLDEVLKGEIDGEILRNPWVGMRTDIDVLDHGWWNLYDSLWVVISELNGRGPSRILPKTSSTDGPSFGQRARGLVESLNIPAAEMAAVVVSGGIGNALGGKPNKTVDKAMLLRGERCPKIVSRLTVLYLCKSSLERASRCVQQVVSLFPSLLPVDEEQSKSKLQFYIWVLLAIRSQYGKLDDGARFHVISHLIREGLNYGKSLLAASMVNMDTSDSGGNSKDTNSIHNLFQKERVLAAVSDEIKYIKTSMCDRSKQLDELRTRMDENSSLEFSNKKVFEDEILGNLNSILASDDSRRSGFHLAHEEEQQNFAEKWIHMFRTLIDERGPWSANPFPNAAVTHWKLDKTEDAWRRRPKLKRNYHFDEKLCHPPSSSVSNQDNIPTSDSKISFVAHHIPEQMKQFLLKGIRRITEDGNSEAGEDDPWAQKSMVPEDNSERQISELVKGSSDQKEIVQEKGESSSSAEADASEVLVSFPCVLVTPKRKMAGSLAVMKTVLHFFGELLVEGTGGSSVFKNLNSGLNSEATKLDQKNKSVKGPIHNDWRPGKGITAERAETANENEHEKNLKHIKRHRRWCISKIKAVHWTRHLLRYTAIEIFFADSTAPVFLNFGSLKDAKEVGSLIVATRNELLFPKGSNKDKSGYISFVDRRAAVEIAEIARESWRRRDMTNFEYLMILNSLAGRSYNDLTQYPVFPWILADYSSETLDFNKSSTFRDLSKPVGALDQKRFEVFEDRYRNFSDPDIPSFYYGSHYSSMGIVLYYLLRLEPFTSLHRNMQGGKFDHADRLFQSIEGTFRNCLSNTSDVKELIPEFFYMPEFLVNANSYHLGVKQDGDPISHVCLPPWAKGSPELFIKMNREALESEYVSSNLHHWIDLVFGCKQRGKPAVEAANIFYYLTYEGAVDLETMDDDLQRSAIEDQIANFGQTPIQIFRKKHPRRGPPIPIAHPLYFAPDSINLTSIVTSISPSAVLYVGLVDSNIVIVSQGLTLSVKLWLTTQLQSGGTFTFSGSQDPFFGVGGDVLSSRKIASPLAENFEIGAQCFATMLSPAENFLISCGNWENSFQVISLHDGRTVQSIRQHKDVVSCVAVSADNTILATGSYDTTVMVWEVVRARGHEKRVRNAQTEVPRRDHVIAQTPFHILCGHDDIITCLFVSVELDIVISGSKDGTCIFHTLREGRYVRSLRHPSGHPLSKLVASRHGHIVFYAEDDLSLHLYSINGKHLASSESNGRLNCIELSRCGDFLVCAGDQGQIVVRSMHNLDVVKRYVGAGKMITSLAVTPEQCFLAGTKDGHILVYSIENPQLRRAGAARNKTRGSGPL